MWANSRDNDPFGEQMFGIRVDFEFDQLNCGRNVRLFSGR